MAPALALALLSPSARRGTNGVSANGVTARRARAARPCERVPAPPRPLSAVAPEALFGQKAPHMPLPEKRATSAHSSRHASDDAWLCKGCGWVCAQRIDVAGSMREFEAMLKQQLLFRQYIGNSLYHTIPYHGYDDATAHHGISWRCGVVRPGARALLCRARESQGEMTQLETLIESCVVASLSAFTLRLAHTCRSSKTWCM